MSVSKKKPSKDIVFNVSTSCECRACIEQTKLINTFGKDYYLIEEMMEKKNFDKTMIIH
jgi:hypothetical protein